MEVPRDAVVAALKLCVLVKAVPDAGRRIDPATGRLDRSGEGGLNVADRYAVEAALQLRAARAGGEVIAVTMGPAGADLALRRALAMGCERAVHVSDPALAGSDIVGTASVLARVIEREQPELVLLGERSSDGGGGVMGAVVAALLGWPVVCAARALSVAGGRLVAEQITEFGWARLAVDGRAVVSVAIDANTPRYASLKQTIEARERPLEVLSGVALGVGPGLVGAEGAGVSCADWRAPAARSAGVVCEPDSVDGAVDAIERWMGERGLL